MKIRKFHTAREALRDHSAFEVLFGEVVDSERNHFSILIGENGTRKSRTLRDIVDIAALREVRGGGVYETKTGSIELWQNKASNSRDGVAKIIAVSGVATDRFPSRITSRTRTRSPDFYRYIGPRTDNNLVSRVQGVNQLALSLLTSAERVKSRYRQLKQVFAMLQVSHGILFEFMISPRENGGSWTLSELRTQASSSKNRWAIDRTSADESLLKRCVRVLKSKEPIELRLDLDDVVRIDASPDDLEALAWLLGSGLLSVRNSYVNENDDNGMLPLSEFSSGQWHLLSSLLFTAIAVEDNSLILVDEPENSLHPAWQQEYLRLMRSVISSSRGVHVIVATHSPLVAASLNSEDAEVIQLKNRRGRITAKEVEAGPFGWTADKILQEVFGLESSRSVEFTQQMDEALALFAKGDRTNPRLKRLVTSLEATLPHLASDDVAREVIETLSAVLDVPAKGRA
ncbi:ATP-binding protein [Dyella sp. C11]|uniref:ATP-binding protein n=1 Tax=Dyella sp. C11 TaxID=2126991 RepID=UPI000D649704|nr:ATP-binding protein [Dyella sp. C11]